MITDLLLRSKKINIFLVFITKFYFAVQKSIKLISTYHFTSKVAKKQELRQILINDSSDIEFKDFIKLYQKNVLYIYIYITDKNFLIKFK